MRRHLLAALLPLGLLPGCASTAAPGETLVMARPLGTLQCEPDGPTAASLASALREAGVTVRAVGCGHDGRMRPAVCGAPDGRLAVAEIPAGQQARAAALGWQPLSTWPEAQRQPC